MHSLPHARKPRWYAIPARVLLVTFLMSLLSFAVSLLLAILGLVMVAKLQGTTPDMRLAYRGIALPLAGAAGLLIMVLSLLTEIRHYRQSRTLSGIVRASR